MSPTAPIRYATRSSFDVNEQPQISVGGNNPIINLVRNCLNIPSKVIYWNSGFGSGNVTEQSVKKVQNYLKENGLEEVQIQVNEWDPVKHIGRVFSNPKTGVISKLTIGVFESMRYILVPYKLINSADRYNILSDDVHLFSNDEGFNLKPAIEAKRYDSYSYPVASRLIEHLPLIGNLLTFSRNLEDAEEGEKYITSKEENRHHARSTLKSLKVASNMRAYRALSDTVLAQVLFPGVATILAIALAHINS